MFMTLKNFLKRAYDLDSWLIELAEKVERDASVMYREIEDTSRYNQLKVLHSFREAGVTEYHLKETTGYGYGDLGRDTLDKIYARLFGFEAGLVRAQIVSGTHALALALYGNLKPGDHLLSVTGEPYDTLTEIIGSEETRGAGSLRDLGVTFSRVPLLPTGVPDLEGIKTAVTPDTRMVYIQRSSGYSWRSSLTIEKIREIIQTVKQVNPNTICLVDNCYGEFVQRAEPGEVGADLAAGSLIKNPGGGLAPTGGYLVGKKEYIQGAARRMTAPGIEGNVGSSLGVNRWFYQGLYMSPHIVGESLKGAVFAARLFERLGLKVSPRYDGERGDIIQAIEFGRPESLVQFCQAVQGCSPVDSMAKPVPGQLPGYDHEVIMAAGCFVQGATLELSADAPMREPYIAYLQGGLMADHTWIAALCAAQSLWQHGYLPSGSCAPAR
ncbi:MAG: hypothetical protein HPY50_16205 [Firmicutes bacterium]|nr:hypothetical protein [Bacillota bacterium]